MSSQSHMDENSVVIQMKDIVKKFGDFTANDHINLTVHKGEVHAILGENGAGKSTLMNVLYGLYRPTSGQIFINGQETHLNSPKHAIEMGIGMVHQHFMLIQPFTVTDNIILGVEPTKGLVVDEKLARSKVLELSERYGMSVEIAANAAEAVKDADIVCTLTPAKTPYLTREMVRPGTHINAVGTFTPTTREVASDLVAAARLYADHIQACRAESGEYLIPLKEKLISENHILGSLGQLLTGKAAGRASDDEITLFDALGLAVEDIASAKAVLVSKMN